jgi:hypothetical protein
MIFVDTLTYLECPGMQKRNVGKLRMIIAYSIWLFRLSGGCIIFVVVLIEVVSPNPPTHHHIVSF